MDLDLEQFIFALSDTVDLVGVDEILHAKRVAAMAWKCAETLGYDQTRQRFLFHLGLLHDCGVSSTEERSHLIQDLEWDNSHIHCQTGAERMAFFKPLAHFALPIQHHHTRWEKIEDTDLSQETRLDANLIYMLDRVDYFGRVTPGADWLAKKDIIRNKLNTFKGTYFNRELVDAFFDVSDNEAFWFSLESIMITDFIDHQKQNRQTIRITNDELKTIATLFAQIVDAKSQFTAEHSLGVARLCSFLAGLLKLDPQSGLKIEVAGLLHDLGKLQVPDRVLDNPGPLLGGDLTSMRHHSYATYRILHNVSGLEDIATWAGNHHEALDGSGYPFRRTADELGIESRIIAIADIFQALAQNRPYRKPQPLENILNFLKKNSQRGRLDSDIIAIVVANSDACYEHAVVT